MIWFRKNWWQRLALECVAALVVCVGMSALAQEISFNHVIRPILSDRCFTCHGPNERRSKLRLDRATGENGAYRIRYGSAAIKPGSLQESELWHRITTSDADDVMPPLRAHKKPLSAEEKRAIRLWIEAGAPYEEFWSFVPPEMPLIPVGTNGGWSQQRIDLHVLRRLQSAGLTPSEEADKRTLIRRVTFDLTGLPPTREEVRAFLAAARRFCT